MSTINILDIATILSGNETWYEQQTTGRIPEARMDFCIAMAAAPDKSSYNMHANRFDPEKNALLIYVDTCTGADLQVKHTPIFGHYPFLNSTGPRLVKPRKRLHLS